MAILLVEVALKTSYGVERGYPIISLHCIFDLSHAC